MNDPCGLDSCACCREMYAQSSERLTERRKRDAAEAHARTLDALLREALAVVSDWWEAKPGKEPADLFERADALMAKTKPCSCGYVYLASEWAALPRLGIQRGVRGYPDLELKNCVRCKSTMAVEV